MNNMITISSMSRAFRQTPVRRPSKNDVRGASFADCVQKEADKQNIPNNETMRSVDEYRTYLNDKLQNLSFDSSNRMDTTMVSISDVGINRMMKDPEYEKWVICQVSSMISTDDPFSGMAGGKFIIMRFGERESDLSVTIERAGFSNGQDSMMPKTHKDEDENFWNRRQNRLEEQIEISEEIREREAEGLSIMINPFLDISGKKAIEGNTAN